MRLIISSPLMAGKPVIGNHLFHLMNLSTRLDYLGPANLCLRLRRTTARPALRPLRNSPERRPPLWTGHFSVFAGLEFPTRNGRSKAKRPVRHRFEPVRLKSTFEALRREGADFTAICSSLLPGMFARLVRSTPASCVSTWYISLTKRSFAL